MRRGFNTAVSAVSDTGSAVGLAAWSETVVATVVATVSGIGSAVRLVTVLTAGSGVDSAMVLKDVDAGTADP